jgi:hypothetical protein
MNYELLRDVLDIAVFSIFKDFKVPKDLMTTF